MEAKNVGSKLYQCPQNSKAPRYGIAFLYMSGRAAAKGYLLFYLTCLERYTLRNKGDRTWSFLYSMCGGTGISHLRSKCTVAPLLLASAIISTPCLPGDEKKPGNKMYEDLVKQLNPESSLFFFLTKVFYLQRTCTRRTESTERFVSYC